jgi:very-short-patch-repair endonuclease
MVWKTVHSTVWAAARAQHGVITRSQLLELDFSSRAIEHRVAKGRLHPVHRGVYAVGRPELTQRGVWMAAVLACGPTAALSHDSAAALYRIRSPHRGPIHVSLDAHRRASVPGITVHRRAWLTTETDKRDAIPVTTIVATIIDLATRVSRDQLEAAINEADKHDLIDPDQLRAALDTMTPRPGLATVRRTLDRRTFTLTDTELERRFKPIAKHAGLPLPLTQQRVTGHKVDFYWPELGLVVETDGLRYHRTPAQQAKDRVRDQAHTAAGLTPLRFTRAQVRYEPERVQTILTAVARRLADATARP